MEVTTYLHPFHGVDGATNLPVGPLKEALTIADPRTHPPTSAVEILASNLKEGFDMALRFKRMWEARSR